MEQLRVGICDDEEYARKRIEEQVAQILRENLPDSLSVQIQTFGSGDAIYRECLKDSLSLAFLDIEMPGQNGMELAIKLSDINPDISIVFVSNHQNYIFEAQEYEPLWFVRKAKLQRDLLRAIQKYLRKNSYKWIKYKIDDGFGKRNIPLYSIWYFKCTGHEVEVVTGEEEYCMYGSLTSISKELTVHGFVQIHRNYLVNSRRISHVIGNELELQGGKRLPLGRRYKREVMERMRGNAWGKDCAGGFSD